jgi:hypothetical protein
MRVIEGNGSEKKYRLCLVMGFANYIFLRVRVLWYYLARWGLGGGCGWICAIDQLQTGTVLGTSYRSVPSLKLAPEWGLSSLRVWGEMYSFFRIKYLTRRKSKTSPMAPYKARSCGALDLREGGITEFYREKKISKSPLGSAQFLHIGNR